MTRSLRFVGASDATAPSLALATKLDTLEDVLRAGFDVLAIVVQDEYTHDVIARRGADPYVCFDTT